MACKHWQGDARDAPPGAFSSDGLTQEIAKSFWSYSYGGVSCKLGLCLNYLLQSPAWLLGLREISIALEPAHSNSHLECSCLKEQEQPCRRQYSTWGFSWRMFGPRGSALIAHRSCWRLAASARAAEETSVP